MGKASRMLKRKTKTPKTPAQRYSLAELEAVVNHEKAKLLEDVFFRVVAMSALVLDDNFGKLQRKDTRIENYATLLAERLERFTLDCPEDEKKVIEQLKRAGLQMIKDT